METPQAIQRSAAWMWIGIVAAGAAARLLPHPWNFTPLIAIGLFAGARARRAVTGVLAVLLSLALSDIVLGFHRGFEWVYAAALIPVLLGRLARSRGFISIAAAALASSLSFFVVTNFAVWAAGQLYPRTLAGLGACYVAALPFYGNQFAGDVFYTVLMFGGYALLARRRAPVLRPVDA
ncbi:MAG: hypothetical protein JO307_21110 [Bryobacterales bacterium]|nr:hypothetical protein [Bryobacterales bacterium]MBV9398168.1 hypothetical protein [Bryobacterales bacterium]